VKHPNTITVIDYGKTEDNIYYIAMEYVEGIT
jgi:serine/threonine-protein kinase